MLNEQTYHGFAAYETVVKEAEQRGEQVVTDQPNLLLIDIDSKEKLK